jgi:hypothetical protein
MDCIREQAMQSHFLGAAFRGRRYLEQHAGYVQVTDLLSAKLYTDAMLEGVCMAEDEWSRPVEEQLRGEWVRVMARNAGYFDRSIEAMLCKEADGDREYMVELFDEYRRVAMDWFLDLSEVVPDDVVDDAIDAMYASTDWSDDLALMLSTVK